MKEKKIAIERDCFFDTGHLVQELKSKAVRGGFNMMAARVVSFVLRMGSMVILARILMPEDFGLIGMVTAVTIIAEQFKDLGLSKATVQRKEITHEQVSTLFWINVGFGTLSMFILSAFAWVLAWFYGDPRLIGITLGLSSSLFLGGLAVQHQALLQRQMRFRELAWIQIVSDGLSIATSIGLASQGFAYWALVWKEISRSVFIVVGTWWMCPWLPGRPSRATGVHSMLRFGGHVSGFNVVTFLSQNFDQILLGKLWGAGPLGFYRQARQTLSIPLGQLYYPVVTVAEPALSALQNDPERYSKYFEKIVCMLSFVSMPLVAYLAIFSDPLIRVLLGERWAESASILRVFAISGLVSAPAETLSVVMITSGKTRRFFWYGIASAILVIFAFGIGAFWGPIGVATAYTVTACVWIFPSLWYCYRDTPVSLRGIAKAMFKPAFCSFFMGLLLVLVSPEFSRLGNFEIPLSLAFGFVSYCGAWLLFPGGMAKLKEYFSYPLLALGIRANFK